MRFLPLRGQSPGQFVCMCEFDRENSVCACENVCTLIHDHRVIITQAIYAILRTKKNETTPTKRMTKEH